MRSRLRLTLAALVLAVAAVALLAGAPALQGTAPPAPAPSPGPVGSIYQQIVRPGTAGRVGEEAPLFAWVTPLGQLTDLEALRGGPVVINFWATWCVPCRQEMPTLERAATGRPEIVFLEVDLQEDPEVVAAFFARYGLTHLEPVVDPQAKTTIRYGVLSLPATFFIDATGVIRYIRLGGPMSEEEIELGIAKASGAN